MVVTWTTAVVVFMSVLTTVDSNEGRQRYDGWFNNYANARWGGVGDDVIFAVPPAYDDLTYTLVEKGRPNARLVSNEIFSGPSGLPSYQNHTALFAFFGQMVSFELYDGLNFQCPIELYKIAVPKGDRDFNCTDYLSFVRSGYNPETGNSPNNPRRPVNQASSWIDASFVYGVGEVWSNTLREFVGGRLVSEEGKGKFPGLNRVGLPIENRRSGTGGGRGQRDSERLWMFGDTHAHQNPALAAIAVVWFRYHNYQARRLQDDHPDWKDERIYQAARRRVIAVYQNIVMYQYLPALLGHGVPSYSGYQSHVQPSISAIFASAAIKVVSSQIPPGIYLRDRSCQFNKNPIRLCNSYFNAQELLKTHDVSEVMMGLTSQISERQDHVVVNDLRGQSFGSTHYSREDEMTLAIMQGRDHGLPDYNVARKAYRLPLIHDWDQLNPWLSNTDPKLIGRLRETYGGRLSSLDILSAGFLESTPQGVGPLFTSVILQQFARIRDADRYWFENVDNGQLTSAEIDEIKETRFSDVVRATTNLSFDDIQTDVFHWNAGDPCQQPRQLREEDLEPCTPIQMYDFFTGSETSYIISFVIVGLIPLACILVACILIRIQKYRWTRTQRKTKVDDVQKRSDLAVGSFGASEWRGSEEAPTRIEIRPNFGLCTLTLLPDDGSQSRVIDVTRQEALDVQLSSDKRRNVLLLNVRREYDVVVIFDGEYDRAEFVKTLQQLGGLCQLSVTSHARTQSSIYRNAVTKTKRQHLLTKFFKHAFADAYKIEELRPADELLVKDRKKISECQLSKAEFASALALCPESIFVSRMFALVDRDQDGYVSFREILHTMLLFSKGTADEKLRLLFDMYDTNGNEQLSLADVTAMFRSIIDLTLTTMTSVEIEHLVNDFCTSSGLDEDQSVDFETFTKLFSNRVRNLGDITLQWKGAKSHKPAKSGPTNKLFSDVTRNDVGRSDVGAKGRGLQSKGIADRLVGTPHSLVNRLVAVRDYIENHCAHIVILLFFYSVCLFVFVERFYFYAVQQEDSGLRRLFGYWVSLSRGSAAGMCFTYSLLLLTISNNTITWLRESILNRYVPFDSSVQFHIVVAYTALAFTVMHVFGYCFTFYQLATQPVEFLCGVDEFFFSTDRPPSFHYWLYGTLAGMTGLLLIVVLCIIFVFAQARVRTALFAAFWLSHRFFYAVYVLTLLHGCYRILQTPAFPIYLGVPASVFALDKLVSLRRRVRALHIVRTKKLPSDVVSVEFERPADFHYKCGQWIRLACSALGKREYHSLTLSSSPHEDTLSVHVRAVGPWTTSLMRIAQRAERENEPYPEVFVDGPFGSGQQDWFKFDVSILVAAGIGVTPYASILKHFAHLHSINNTYKMKCRKLYFIWAAASHKGYEWMVDILHDVEDNDHHGVVEMHCFITQFFQQFDLRTTMLYVCEEHFQRSEGRSMFTGLKATTHFGRPNMEVILDAVRDKHPKTRNIGVFSCGPPGLTKTVHTACDQVSNKSKTNFKHYHENF